MADVSEAPTVEIGTIVSGTLELGNAAKLFQFTAAAGQKLLFDSLSNYNYRNRWTIYNSDNQYVAGEYFSYDRDLTISRSDTYTLVLSGGEINSTVDYSFQIIDAELVTTNLTLDLDAEVTGSIETAGSRNVYSFSGTAGQRLYFDGLSDNSQVDTALLAPNGDRLFSIYSRNNSSLITLSETGTYQLVLDGQGDTIAAYRFRMLDASTADTVETGETVSGTLAPGNASKLFQFTAAAGQKLFFDSLSAYDYSNRWNIYDANNQYVAGSRLSSDLELTISDAGTYTLVVDGEANSAVNYSFHLIDVELATTELSLVLDTEVVGSIAQAGARNIYTFSGTAGQRLYFDGLSNDSTVYAELLDSNGDYLLSTYGDGDSGLVTLRETGTYRLVLDGQGDTTDAYRFRLSDVDAAAPLEIGATISGTLAPGNASKLFQFTATAGQKLFFNSSSIADYNNRYRNQWTVYDDENRYVAGNGLSADLELTVQKTGTYTLVIAGGVSDAVEYSFHLLDVALATTERSLALNTVVTNNISQAGGQDVYTFSGTAGQRLYFDGLSDSSVYAELLGPNGDRLFQVDSGSDSYSPISLRETGTYQLVLDGQGDSTAAYRFQLIDLSNVAELDFNNSLTGSFETGRESALYRFTAKAGDTFFLDDQGSERFGGDWTLYDSNDYYIDSTYLGYDFETTFSTDGEYLLRLEGSSSASVGYNAQAYLSTINQKALNLTAAAGGQKSFTYDGVFNHLTSTTDELGRQTLFDLDTRTGNVLATTQVVGALGGDDDIVTRFTYTAQGLVDTVTDSLARTTDYDYDKVGRLSQVRFAVGTQQEARQQFEYDGAGNLTAFTNENGDRTEYRYDARNRLIQTIEADPDGAGVLTSPITRFTYDAAGNLTATVDARGNETQFKYDERNRIVELANAQGDRTRSTYDDAGNLTSIVNALGHTTRYQYDRHNRRIAEIDALGNKTSYRYDPDNNLVAMTDALGSTTNYAYDVRNRLIETTDALGNKTKYAYDATNNLTGLTDRRGNETSYGYDALNRLAQTEDALGGTTAFSYDKANNLRDRSDERGNVTAFDYDARNRLTQTTDALSGKMAYTYDGVGNQLSVTDELNRTTSFTYDTLNRLTQLTDALNHSTSYGYDANGNLTAFTDALGRKTTYGYDTLNRQVGMVDVLGGASAYRYDAVGNLTASTDELGRTTTYGYDERNLLSRMSDPLAQTTTTTYDAVGNAVAVTDALGNKTQYQHDKLYRRTKVVDALGKETSMTYDAAGNLLALTDASGNTTNHTYDQLNRLSTESITVDGAELSRQYTYDAASNLIERENRNGQVQSFTYDQLNRQTQEQWLDEQGSPIRAIDYTYDAASQLTAVRDPDSAYAYAYDAAGRLVSTDNAGSVGVPDVLLRYGYDAVNNRTSVTDEITGTQAGVEAFAFDALDRVTRITQQGTGVTEKRVDITYDAASQMTGLARYSDIAGTQPVADTAYVRDAAGRLTDLTHGRNSSVIADYGFTYDAANRLTQLTTPDGTSDYSYNGRDELTSSDYSYQDDEGYTYDDTGNRTNAGYVTGDHNRLLSDGTYSYEYDNEGNRVRRVDIASGEVTEYGWDTRNRMTSVTTKDSGGTITKSAEYAYDLYDRRIAKSVDSDGEGAATATEERYVYDSEHIALVFDGEGNQLSRYLHSPQIDQVLAEETAAGEVRWALSDHQGSVRDVVDSQGTVLNHLTYDSYGQVTSTNPDVDFRFGYTGREWDEETGLYYYRARYFDPAPGTFVSADPLGFATGDPNIYRYVFNSPTNYTDPSGLLSAFVRGSLVTGGTDYKHRTVRGNGVVSEGWGGGSSIDSSGNDQINPSLTPSFGSSTVGIGSAETGESYTRTQIVTPDLGFALGLDSPLSGLSGTIAWGQNTESGARYWEAGLALNMGIAGGGFRGNFIEGGPIDFSPRPVLQPEASSENDTRGQGFGFDASNVATGLTYGLAFGIGFGIGFGFSVPVIGTAAVIGVGYSLLSTLPGIAAETDYSCIP